MALISQCWTKSHGGDDALVSGPNRDILDGNEGDNSFSGAGNYFVVQSTSGGSSDGHDLQIDSRFRLIADLDLDRLTSRSMLRSPILQTLARDGSAISRTI